MTGTVIPFRRPPPPPPATCSFCGCKEDEAKAFIANADESRHICGRCIAHAKQRIVEETTDEL